METFSTLLALCVGNSPANSPHKGQWRELFNGWVKYREAGDLRRHRALYDVTVMLFCRMSLKIMLPHLPGCNDLNIIYGIVVLSLLLGFVDLSNPGLLHWNWWNCMIMAVSAKIEIWGKSTCNHNKTQQTRIMCTIIGVHFAPSLLFNNKIVRGTLH